MSGRVFNRAGHVIRYWREKRLELTPEQFVEKLKQTKIPEEYPGGPYHEWGYILDTDFSVEELAEWEVGSSDIEFWGLLLRDIATHFGIPTRQVISTRRGLVPGNIAKFRQSLLNLSQEEFAKKLDIPLDLYQKIERGETPLERIGKIYMALAKAADEPIFNFWRPGHHIDRISLPRLAKLREELVEQKKLEEEQAKRDAEKIKLLHEEREKRLAARQKRLAEIEAIRGKEK